MCSTTASSKGSGTTGLVVDALGELPCPPAGNSELVDERLRGHGCDVAHRVQAEAVHAAVDLGVDREQVDGVRREEGRCIGRDARNARRIAGQGCHERGELGVAGPDPRSQVVRQRTEQGIDRPVLAAVQPLEAVQANVGDPKARALDAVADSLQRGEHARLKARWYDGSSASRMTAPALRESASSRVMPAVTLAHAGKRSATSGLPRQRSAMTTALSPRCGCRCSSTFALRWVMRTHATRKTLSPKTLAVSAEQREHDSRTDVLLSIRLPPW